MKAGLKRMYVNVHQVAIWTVRSSIDDTSLCASLHECYKFDFTAQEFMVRRIAHPISNIEGLGALCTAKCRTQP